MTAETNATTPPILRGVHFDKRDLFYDFVPPTEPGPGLASRALAVLAEHFEAIQHQPTPEMWLGLSAAVNKLEEMADGDCAPSIYLSSLDPGVGKTTAIIYFIKILLASKYHQHTAVLICLRRREQIASFITAAGLCREDFAVLTADEGLNALGSDDPTKARILFTTHSMVEKRTAGGSFTKAKAFHYRGSPRAVRIWDEAILPGRPISVSRDAIASLLEPLRGRHPALAADLEELFDGLKTAEDRDCVHLPDLQGKHGVSLGEALRGIRGISDTLRQTIDDLSFLLNRTVTVRQDGAFGIALVGYRDTLPDHLAPILVLDASARVRSAYHLWHEHRGGVTFLPSATKSYENLTIHYWDHSGGKRGLTKDRDEVVEAVATTIMKRPDEPWLVVRYLDMPELESDLRKRLPMLKGNLHFLHWGIHDATNAFAHVPNVILVGTQFQRPSQYEALGQLVFGSSNPVPPPQIREVEAGELRNLILQAVGRGSVRRCERGRCPKAHAHVIGSSRHDFPRLLREVFPGARIVPWRATLKPLKGKVRDAVEFIAGELNEKGKDFVTASAAMKKLGWTDVSNFRKRIRQHPNFTAALADRGIIEVDYGSGPVTFERNPFTMETDKVTAHEWDF